MAGRTQRQNVITDPWRARGCVVRFVTAAQRAEFNPLHKVDLRVSKDIALRRGVNLTGVAEAFNRLNDESLGSYDAQVTSARFSQPTQYIATPIYHAPLSSPSVRLSRN
jgi:hypothetical protein